MNIQMNMAHRSDDRSSDRERVAYSWNVIYLLNLV